MPLSIQQKKFVNSLHQKKYRQINNLFIVEGEKNVNELLNSDLNIVSIYCLNDWYSNNEEKIKKQIKVEIISSKELSSISELTTPNKVLAVATPKENIFNKTEIVKNKILLIDSVRDPGNLGTIIRTANWFGVNNIVASEDTVEFYNSKTIQATMGAFAKVNYFTTNIIDFLKTLDNEIPVYGALLNGEDINDSTFEKNGILIISNESNGLSKELLPFVTKKVKIPSFSNFDKKYLAESLNVSVASGILLYEFCKK